MQHEHIKVPADGTKITVNPNTSLNVPDNPIIPFVEGDGIGVDVTPAMLRIATRLCGIAAFRRRVAAPSSDRTRAPSRARPRGPLAVLD